VVRVDPNARITSGLLATILRNLLQSSQPYFESRSLLRNISSMRRRPASQEKLWFGAQFVMRLDDRQSRLIRAH
jgi:hypothetical protein